MHNSKQPTLLTDYKPSNFKITNVKLLFQLDPNCTKVTSKLSITTQTKNTDLILDGKNLDLKYLKINGKKKAKERAKEKATDMITEMITDSVSGAVEGAIPELPSVTGPALPLL